MSSDSKINIFNKILKPQRDILEGNIYSAEEKKIKFSNFF